MVKMKKKLYLQNKFLILILNSIKSVCYSISIRSGHGLISLPIVLPMTVLVGMIFV